MRIKVEKFTLYSILHNTNLVAITCKWTKIIMLDAGTLVRFAIGGLGSN